MPASDLLWWFLLPFGRPFFFPLAVSDGPSSLWGSTCDSSASPGVVVSVAGRCSSIGLFSRVSGGILPESEPESSSSDAVTDTAALSSRSSCRRFATKPPRPPPRPPLPPRPPRPPLPPLPPRVTVLPRFAIGSSASGVSLMAFAPLFLPMA